MDPSAPLDRRKPSNLLPSRSFLVRTLAPRRASEDATSDDKGPLGLTTLYQPLETVIADLIFVHGLGGGSRSTWSKDGDPALYWPQEWLPQETSFQQVRIQTFGYNSNYEKESTLNIHDFAKSLLGWMKDSPSMPRDSSVPIVFVCHSMGGLVAKRAYVLARQFTEYASIAQRVRAIFFLATPHRGSDMAHTLTKILHVVPGARPFVNDLHRNSLAIQSINDEFPHHCHDLQLYSFYETLPMSFGVTKSIIVSKDSAVLGYSNEQDALLNANHREVCKYANREDPNYLVVRNALASFLDDIRSSKALARRKTNLELQLFLDQSLGVYDAPYDDYMRVESLRIPGSCAWIAETPSFQTWRDMADTQLYWITAKPATGKSVLSGYIIKYLRDLGHTCVFYFFSHNDKTRSNPGAFLRSVAWQLASICPEISDIVLKICKRDSQLATADFRTIWRKLFLEGILRAKVSEPQFWVVDAVDECNNDLELVSLLLKAADTSNVLRIFLTCRNGFESYGQTVHPGVRVVSEAIPPDSTKSDIQLYLRSNIESLPALGSDKVHARKETMDKILEKSAGCFLWVSLVLQELKRVHTAAEIQQVLEDVPSDMDELYMRILDSMSKLSYGKPLAKAILTWTICAARPLSTEELYHALQIDVNDDIDSVQRSIASSCGQVVYVDSQSRVQIIHQTARAFLTRPDNPSEFGIDKRAGHRRLAMVCLQYLSGPEMTGPRHRKLSASLVVRERCPFVKYACNSLNEHIPHVSSTDDDFMLALGRFLNSSNALSWIEYIAKESDLNRLVQTGRALKNYLRRRSTHTVPLGKEVMLLESWSADLLRLVTKFGKNLSESPTSIFYLIPPFCPPDTALKKQFATSSRAITVTGLSAASWDDCSSTITFREDVITALACSENLFAVGLTSGKIVVYNGTTCQEIKTLQQRENVRLLLFSDSAKVLASCSLRSIYIWKMGSWEQLWSLSIDSLCLSLAFTDNDRLLLGALKNNQLLIWDLTSGILRECTCWLDDLDEEYSGHFRRPIAAAFAKDLSLLAIAYRGQDIILWDIERDTLYDIYGRETGAQSGKRLANVTVLSLIFNQAPEACLLAAAFTDGDIVLFSTSEGTIQATVRANAQTLACSADGFTLASGDSAGTIQIFEFETLKLLYRIKSEESGIKSLAFSADSQRLIDVRGSHCRVWDPTILVRQDATDENSDTVSISTVPQDYHAGDVSDTILITAVACAYSGGVFFCGKEDGSVYLYDSKTGQQHKALFHHSPGVAIVSLVFDERSSLLASADSSSRVMVHKLLRVRGEYCDFTKVLDHRTGVAIEQILVNEDFTRMLLCSTSADTLWSINPTGPDSCVRNVLSWEARRRYRWTIHPSDPKHLILVTENTAHVFDWDSLKPLTSGEGIFLEGAALPELVIRSVTSCFNGTAIAMTFAESLASRSRSRSILWDAANFEADRNRAAPIPHYQPLADHVEFLIGAYGQRLVFLHEDGWICSADSQSFDVEYFDRHFFIPADWLSTTQQLMIEIFKNGTIIFVKRDEVAVIKRGMEHFEQGQTRALGKRPSLSRSGFSDSSIPRW